MSAALLSAIGEASAETATYWEATAAGVLMLRWCKACGQPHHYPRTLCPFCFGETEWRESTGHGEIYSFSIQRRVSQEYAIAYVMLEEGVAILTRIVDCRLEDVQIGQKVVVAFQPTVDGKMVPVFRPT